MVHMWNVIQISSLIQLQVADKKILRVMGIMYQTKALVCILVEYVFCGALFLIIGFFIGYLLRHHAGNGTSNSGNKNPEPITNRFFPENNHILRNVFNVHLHEAPVRTNAKKKKKKKKLLRNLNKMILSPSLKRRAYFLPNF